MSFENRNYIIFDTTETGSIDFTEVKETSANTLRLSVSGSQTFVKYNGDTMPPSVSPTTSHMPTAPPSEQIPTKVRKVVSYG